MDADSQLPASAKFQELLDLYGPALRRLCSAYARNWTDQQDLFQEIALAVWTALPRFRGDASVRTWLYRIAHNVAITTSIRRQRSRSHEIQADPLPPVSYAADDRREQLLDVIRRLETVDRELIVLYLEGLSTREISTVLGITEANAAVKLTRVRQRLSEMLRQPSEVHG